MATTGRAVTVAAIDGIVTFAWTVVTSSLTAAALVLGDFIDWKGDRTPLLYSIILVVNLVFAEVATATGGAVWNPTVPMAFYIVGASQETVLGIALRVPSIAAGAAAGIAAVHQIMPEAYKHTLGTGPSLKADLHQGALMEGFLSFVLTFMVLFVVLRVTSNRYLQTPIIVTGALTLVRFGGALTGPAMNPSDAFGWAFFNSRHTSAEHIFVYWLAPFIGALIAARIFRVAFGIPKVSSPKPVRVPSAEISTTGEKEE